MGVEMKKLHAFAIAGFVLCASLATTGAYADDDNAVEKPEPTLYSHEEHEEGDESLIREEGLFVAAAIAAGAGTVGFLIYRRGKSED